MFVRAFKCQPHKMVKQTHTIQGIVWVCMFDHLAGLALKGQNTNERNIDPQWVNETNIIIHFFFSKASFLIYIF